MSSLTRIVNAPNQRSTNYDVFPHPKTKKPASAGF